MFKQLLLPTWRKMGVTLLLVVLALTLSCIQVATSQVAKRAYTENVMGEQFLADAKAIAERYTCEREAELVKLVVGAEQVQGVTARLYRYWAASYCLMLLVCYLFAGILGYQRPPRALQ